MKAKITKTAVDSLQPGDFISDVEIRGFIARRLPSGTVTFGFQYTAPDGARRWLKLGLHGSVTVEEARTAAKIKAGDVAGGADPAAEAELAVARSTNTVRFVYEEWDAKYAAVAKDGKPLRSREAIAGIFNRHILFAEFETNLRKERQLEGIAKAKAEGKYKGRPASINQAEVLKLKAKGLGASKIARQLGIGRASVYRALAEA